MNVMEKAALARAALKARESAYCPYSNFSVGAALLTVSGRIWTGCNIENAAFGPGTCAERTAVFKAVSEGEREFAALAVTGGMQGNEPERFCAPCGICRQVLAEFCGPEFLLLFVKSETEIEEHTLGELLPQAFGPGMLHREGGADDADC